MNLIIATLPPFVVSSAKTAPVIFKVEAVRRTLEPTVASVVSEMKNPTVIIVVPNVTPTMMKLIQITAVDRPVIPAWHFQATLSR